MINLIFILIAKYLFYDSDYMTVTLRHIVSISTTFSHLIYLVTSLNLTVNNRQKANQQSCLSLRHKEFTDY